MKSRLTKFAIACTTFFLVGILMTSSAMSAHAGILETSKLVGTNINTGTGPFKAKFLKTSYDENFNAVIIVAITNYRNVAITTERVQVLFVNDDLDPFDIDRVLDQYHSAKVQVPPHSTKTVKITVVPPKYYRPYGIGEVRVRFTDGKVGQQY